MSLNHLRWIILMSILITASAVLSTGITAGNGMKVTIHQTEYRGWKHNLKLSNGTVDLVATLFVKQFDYREGATYTDGGSNFETFTNRDFLEVESLGPLERIPAGGSIEHVKRWHLINGIPSDTSDAGIDSAIRKKVESRK